MADKQQQVFHLQLIYLKDTPFKCPGAPKGFLQE